jgi:hypothetical protein
MDEIAEKELEKKLIEKMWRRLENIRVVKNITFPYTTYDTNAILAEIGSEIRQARIVEERKLRKFSPTEPQLRWINDLRKQVDEGPADTAEFTSEQQIDSELARLKNKKKIREKKLLETKA